jgi:hypothetical protein
LSLAFKKAACAVLITLLSPVFAAASDGPTPVPGTAFERREVEDTLGRTVTYYVSRPKQTPAPILLMIGDLDKELRAALSWFDQASR